MNIESLQIHLNSKYADSYNNSSLSDCNFNLPLIEIPCQHTIYLSVQQAVIPYSFYNINSTNNTLFYQEIIGTGVNNTTVYISNGNYNAYQLAVYLSTNLPRTTVSYDIIKNKYTFTNTTNNFKILTAYSTCQDLIGLSTNDLYNTSFGNSLTNYKQINLCPIKSICLASNLQTGCISNTFKNDTNILCSINVANNPYSLIDYKNQNNFRINLHNNVFNSINIKCLDQDGNPLDLNQQYFTLTIQLDIVNFIE